MVIGNILKWSLSRAIHKVDPCVFFLSLVNYLFTCLFFQDLAKELLDLFTAKKMSKVFFTNSGSEANDSQVTCGFYWNNSHSPFKTSKISCILQPLSLEYLLSKFLQKKEFPNCFLLHLSR